jgi:hypothetical protein
MEWVSITPDCEKPDQGERVLVMISIGWEEAEWSDGYFSVPGSEEEIRGVTHGMRVTLPA